MRGGLIILVRGRKTGFSLSAADFLWGSEFTKPIEVRENFGPLANLQIEYECEIPQTLLS